MQVEGRGSHATTTELAALLAENPRPQEEVLDGNTASQATTAELDALRKENQGLKKQVVEVTAASQARQRNWPPCHREQGLKNQVMQVRAAGRTHDTELAALRKENQGLKNKWVEVTAGLPKPRTKELAALRPQKPRPEETKCDVNTAPQAMTAELAALRAENRGLKKQVVEAAPRRKPPQRRWSPCAQRTRA